ncbi:hypothetical protein CZP2022_177 [Vibrio phage C-ZP2022]|nr:hypothetical protein CZP2022_177 [Vibrio phage C-ZP2022]
MTNQKPKQQKQQKNQQPRGMQSLATAIDEAGFEPEVNVGDTVAVMEQSGEIIEGTVVEQPGGEIEVLAEDGEVLASSEFEPEENHPVIEEMIAYVEVMGPQRAPTQAEQTSALQRIESVFEVLFNEAKGFEVASEVLLTAITYGRANPKTFRADRVLRGLWQTYPGNIERQREVQAYATVFAQVMEKGPKARFQRGNLVLMLGEERVERLHKVLSNTINVRIA